MLLPLENLLLLALAFFTIAVVHSSVGFGGGSSYVALLALVLANFHQVRTIALICNLVVVSGSTWLYFKNKSVKIKDFLPFVVYSIPMAFVGASFKISADFFFLLLGCVLIASALLLVFQSVYTTRKKQKTKHYHPVVSYLLGGGIGLVSGLVGIGGGIFLAPVLHHMRWAKPMKIAVVSSFFILVNSMAGLSGLGIGNSFDVPSKELMLLIGVVFIGGQIGARLSLRLGSPKQIKFVTAILVFIIGLRILLVNGLKWI